MAVRGLCVGIVTVSLVRQALGFLEPPTMRPRTPNKSTLPILPDKQIRANNATPDYALTREYSDSTSPENHLS